MKQHEIINTHTPQLFCQGDSIFSSLRRSSFSTRQYLSSLLSKCLLFPLILVSISCLQSCSTEVGGKSDTTAPVTLITSLNDGEEVTGDWEITWNTDEKNKSTVEIHLSYDSGNTYNPEDNILDENTPDEVPGVAINADDGVFMWKTNDIPTLKDCRTCRIKIISTDVNNNTANEPHPESEKDFIINNIPQVLGSALYTDINNDGPGDGDMIRVLFDKDLEILTEIASDIFVFPVLGDSIGPFSTVKKGVNANELIITINEIIGSNFHLHTYRVFNVNKLKLTQPSGLNIIDNMVDGTLFSKDTGRTAKPLSDGIDVISAFVDSGQMMDNNNTFSIALGDIDNDGDIDLVSGNVSMPNRVWTNDGAGVFTDTTNAALLAVGSDTLSVALGDVDGDGDLDLVTGNYSGASDRVWRNDGTGVFSDSGQALGNNTTSEIKLGDIDGDGDLDLVVANVSGANRVWINDGSGVFTDTGQALGDNNTSEIELGDIDGDDDLDIIAANVSGANRVWINNGSGVFTDTSQMLGNSESDSMALGDVDGDGDLDLVVGNRGSTNSKPNSVWTNDGRGVFTDTGQKLGSADSDSIVLGDIDGDGDLDLISGNANGQANRVWVNDGAGIFDDTGQVLLVGNGNTQDIALGDVDNDGDLDLVTGNGSEANRVWINSGRMPNRGFIDATNLALLTVNSNTRDIALGDIDADGDLDLIVASGDSFLGKSDRVWSNDGSGVFTDTGQALRNNDARSIELGDIDGDGDLDLVVGNRGSTNAEPNSVWINDGSGVFTDTGQALGSSLSESITLGDIDGDGDLDLISGNANGQANRVWVNDGTGNFNDTGQELGSSWTTSVTLGDVDGDDDLDLVTGNFSSANRVWRNDGAGVFTDTGQALGNYDTSEIELGDIDDDGDLDLVAGNRVDASRVWRNDGTGVFTDTTNQALIAYSGDTSSIALGDIYGDGDLDLIFGNSVFLSDSSNRVWINDGAGGFADTTNQTLLNVNSDTRSVVLGDLDGDGDIDLVIGNIGAPDRIWLNDF